MAISTNEREFQGDVLKWMREVLSSPFTEVTQETGVEGKFPDAIIWKDRRANVAMATCELKTLETSPYARDVLSNGNRKARDLGAKLLVTWNMSEAVVWKVMTSDQPEQLWAYPPVQMSTSKRWQENADELRLLAHEIIVDLGQFLRDGIPPQRGTPESTVFIEGIHRTVETLVPLYQGLMNAAQNEVLTWCARQTIPTDDGFATAARHAVYRIVGKLLFYQTLARTRSDLPAMHSPSGQSPRGLQDALASYFKSARQIDYQAIFEEHLPDRLPFTDEIADRLRTFCTSFLALNLPRMKVDVFGRIFEALVPGDDKKQLGQYFTEPYLADLIVCSAIRNKNDLVFDPTCGTGGILLRAYAYLRTLGMLKHSDLLDQVWGNDIGDFPTELAMINLFRQEVLDTANFPRIFTKDIFTLRPGIKMEVPPVRATGGITKVMVEMPRFNAVISNPPYLRRQQIGEGTRDPDAYRQRLWGQYPQFGHNSDLYVFVFEKGAEFLEPGGRLCFVTSNAWLDAEYGLELQRWMLRNFRIVAIYESRCEPWFENADINTVVTVLEKAETQALQSESFLHDELGRHEVAFVKFKRPLQQIFNMPLDDPRRYVDYARLVAEINVQPDGFSTPDIHIRKVKQAELYQRLPAPGGISKWGIYLRAPEPFVRLVKEGKKVLPLAAMMDTAFGTLTGKNVFYCPRPNQPSYPHFEKVHEDYRVPIVRTMKDMVFYELGEDHVEGELFVCNVPINRVKGTGTRAYIKWAETQTEDDGTPWPESGEMANREPWYSTRDPVRGDVLFQMFIGMRHCCPANPERFAVLNNLLAGTTHDAKHKTLARCILNSTWFALCNELYGRIHLGGGALKVEKVDLDVMPLPRFDLFTHDQIRSMSDAFDEMRKRKPLPIDQELEQADRMKLDLNVFKALGLTTVEGEELRQAVVRLAKDRHELADQRALRTNARVSRDVKVVVEDIIEAVMPEGFKRFPEDFAQPKKDWEQMPVPSSGLTLVSKPDAPGQGDIFRGDVLYELESDDGYKHAVKHPEQADYLYYAQDGAPKHIAVPPTREMAAKIIRAYQDYVKTTKQKIQHAVFDRVLSGPRAETIAEQIMAQCNLRDGSIPIAKKKKRKR